MFEQNRTYVPLKTDEITSFIENIESEVKGRINTLNVSVSA